MAKIYLKKEVNDDPMCDLCARCCLYDITPCIMERKDKAVKCEDGNSYYRKATKDEIEKYNKKER